MNCVLDIAGDTLFEDPCERFRAGHAWYFNACVQEFEEVYIGRVSVRRTRLQIVGMRRHDDRGAEVGQPAHFPSGWASSSGQCAVRGATLSASGPSTCDTALDFPSPLSAIRAIRSPLTAPDKSRASTCSPPIIDSNGTWYAPRSWGVGVPSKAYRSARWVRSSWLSVGPPCSVSGLADPCRGCRPVPSVGGRFRS